MRKFILIISVLFAVCMTVNAQGKSNLTLSLYGGYSIPVNESYIDTYENDDIYWNPNSGLNLDGRLGFKVNNFIDLVVPLNVTVGFTRYTTTDGRKVNTEANAGNTPETTNTEWSVAPDLGLMIVAKIGRSKAEPYIGVGVSAGYLHSWETWEYTNADGDDAKLVISKFYDLTPVFKGEMGFRLPDIGKYRLKFAATFNMANYIMRKVVLTHYYINGADTIGDWDEKSTVYNYSEDVPDENKGGDCLLAGFNYNNYPQQKISSNLTLKVGITF